MSRYFVTEKDGFTTYNGEYMRRFHVTDILETAIGDYRTPREVWYSIKSKPIAGCLACGYAYPLSGTCPHAKAVRRFTSKEKQS